MGNQPGFIDLIIVINNNNNKYFFDLTLSNFRIL
jgi:hypothetical protein